MKSQIRDYSKTMENNVISSFISKGKVSAFGEDFENSMKRAVKIFKKQGNPPLTTHKLVNENEEIIQLLKNSDLDNREENKVKIIFYSSYVEENDGLLNLTYYKKQT
jgi:flavodoxin